MDKKKLKSTLFDIGKDILIAFVFVCIIMLALFAYCGIWPPMVVVESGSMQRHNDTSVIGVIDTGDMVFVKKVNGVDDVVTYVDGEATGYSKYGNYGDVIIYRPNGMTEEIDGSAVIPIIHRPVVWIDINTSKVSPMANGIDFDNYTFDIPSLGLYGTTENILLSDYGFWNQEVLINLGMSNGLLKYYLNANKVPHGGYITMGDHNVPSYDQPYYGRYEPVLPEWIVGKAIGEIPWFGLVKLKVTGANLQGVPSNSWSGLFITIAIILILPFTLDFILPKIKQLRKKREGSEEVKDAATDEKDGPQSPEETGTGPPSLPDNEETVPEPPQDVL
ncbi:MAG: S26 family signal peptidase [Thermoplasmata archaeon]|nr:S26 family signal peptidase [Thermoplasmata archaeon]